MAISGFVDITISLAYGLEHVIKYRTAIYWADGRATGTYFCENIQKCLKFPLATDFRVYKSSRWFLCTTYGLKHVIEYHKGDKMSI